MNNANKYIELMQKIRLWDRMNIGKIKMKIISSIITFSSMQMGNVLCALTMEIGIVDERKFRYQIT